MYLLSHDSPVLDYCHLSLSKKNRYSPELNKLNEILSDFCLFVCFIFLTHSKQNSLKLKHYLICKNSEFEEVWINLCLRDKKISERETQTDRQRERELSF